MFASLNPPIRDWRTQRVWIVGASSGIGAALAQALLARGARVVLSARDAGRLAEVAAGHPAAEVQAFDASDAAGWRAAVAARVADDRPVDLFVYCAADYQPERSWEVRGDAAARTIGINLVGVYRALEALLPALRARRRGGIALVASVAGYVGLPGAAVYGPTKAALINLAELLYCELAPLGLGVYLVNPGFVSTRLTAKNAFRMPGLLTPPQAAAAIVAGFERGRFEIHFPRRFTLWMKLLRALPQSWRLRLLRRLAPA